MTLYLPEAMPGTRRFLEYARAQGYEPAPVEMKPGDGATTLVYATGMPVHTYFLVLQKQYPKERISRRAVRHIIGKCDVIKSREEGKKSVDNEMHPGYMTPFVSERFSGFSVCLDRSSFECGNEMAFPAGANGNGFSLPANAVKELLIGLYGKEKVCCADLLA